MNVLQQTYNDPNNPNIKVYSYLILALAFDSFRPIGRRRSDGLLDVVDYIVTYVTSRPAEGRRAAVALRYLFVLSIWNTYKAALNDSQNQQR